MIWHPRNLRWLPSRLRSPRDTYSGSNEQMFGAKEQVPGREQNDYLQAESPGTGIDRALGRSRAVKQSLIMNQPIDRLRCHFDLTPAEARLALHLVTGETLRFAAAKLSITYETARTSLKNIFRKTGTCRQAELVVIILTALPDCLKRPVT